MKDTCFLKIFKKISLSNLILYLICKCDKKNLLYCIDICCYLTLFNPFTTSVKVIENKIINFNLLIY